jgi:hypothetical protein
VGLRAEALVQGRTHSGTGGSTESVDPGLIDPVPGTDRAALSNESRGDKEVPVTVMSARFLLTAGLTLLLLGGCRRDTRTQLYIDNVNAEKRMLEDTLYDLQYDYETKLKEVERLQSELARLKAGGTGTTGTGSTPRIKAPSASGGNLFPDIPDLKPPTVEPGTPDTGKTLPDKVKAPPKENPRELQDMDDLEPPKLELPEEQGKGPTSAEPAGTKVTESIAPPEKTASRWTPRSVRRPDPPRRRFNVADNPETSSSAADSSGPAAATATGNATNGPLPNPSSADGVPKQAHLPAWRPYR